MYSQVGDKEIHHDWTEPRGVMQLEEYERAALPGDNVMSVYISLSVWARSPVARTTCHG